MWSVAGKKEAVTVWEPMPQEAFAQKQDTIKIFDTARNLFYEAKFQEALPLFEKLQNEDRPSAFYAEQARYFIENPGGWKGYWEAKKK